MTPYFAKAAEEQIWLLIFFIIIDKMISLVVISI
jgi:hypothetical protein